MRNGVLINIKSFHSTVNTFVPGLLLLHRETGSQKKSVASLAMMPYRQDS